MLTIALPTRRRTPIGLDIGESAVRAVQLRRTNDRYALTAAAQVERTPGSTGRSDEPASAVRAVLRRASFQGRTLVSALHTPEVEFHVLDLPVAALRASASDAEQMVRIEISRLTNAPPEEVETRYWTLPPSSGTGPGAIGVSVGRSAVVQLVNACAEANADCACVDTGATALGRFGMLLRRWPDEALWGVLDMGARSMRLVLCLRETPVLVRDVGPGGTEWTRCVAESLQLTSGAAEMQKRAHGISLPGRGAREERNGDSLRREVGSLMLGALRGHLNGLASEIKRSYEYALSCYPGRLAGELVLVGGGATMRNIREFLSDALGIVVRRASDYLPDPDCRLGFGADERKPLESFAVAVGLAVGDVLGAAR